MDLAHRLLDILQHHDTSRKPALLPSSGKKHLTCRTLWIQLISIPRSKDVQQVRCFLPEDGSRAGFRNIAFVCFQIAVRLWTWSTRRRMYLYVNLLNAELNPICCLLALLGAHHFLHVSRIRVKHHRQNRIVLSGSSRSGNVSKSG
jgi:hypothetical protein